MATEYTVALRDGVSGPAGKAKAAAVALRSELQGLESRRATVSVSARRSSVTAGIREEQRAAREKERSLAKEVRDRDRAERAMLRSELQRIRGAQREEMRAAAAKSRARSQTRGAAKDVIGGAVAGIGAGLVAGGVAAIGYVAQQAIETTKLLEGAKMTLGALYKDQKKADATVSDIYKFAKATKFESPDLIRSLVQISTVVEDQTQQRALLGAFSDISTMLNLNGEQLQRALVNIQQAFSSGHVETRDLKELILDLPGLKGDELKLAMADLAGIQGKNREETIKKLNDAVSKKQIGPKTLVSAFEKTVLKQTGKARLGEYAEQMGDTLEGVISNIKSGLGDLFGLANIEQWPAMQDLKTVLKGIADGFDPATENGRKLTSALKQMASLVSPVLKLGAGLVALGVWLAGKPALMEAFGRGVRMLAQGLLLAGAVVGGVIGGFFALAGAVEMAVEKAVRLGIAGYKAASDFVAGLVQGIKDGVGRVWTAVSELGSAAVAAIKDKLKISSPSRVAMQLGAYTGEGFALGIEKTARGVGSAAAGISGAAAGNLRGAGGGGGASGFSITNNIYVTGTGGDPGYTADQIEMKMEAVMMRSVERFLGRQVAMGAA